MEVPKMENIIKYDHRFILALRESPLVGVPDNFDGSFMYVYKHIKYCKVFFLDLLIFIINILSEIYTDRRKKMYRNGMKFNIKFKIFIIGNFEFNILLLKFSLIDGSSTDMLPSQSINGNDYKLKKTQ